MRNLLLVLLVLFTVGCSSKPLTEDQATDTIAKLPEVKTFMSTMDKQSPPVKTLITTEVNEGAPGNDYYMVAVAEGHPTRVVTVMRFFINKHTGRILVHDVINDTNVPIDQWRKKK